MLGGEPILTRDGGALTDGHGRHPYVTTAGSAPSLGRHLLLAYLPPEQAVARHRARRFLHGGALPGDGRLGRRHRLFDPGERADRDATGPFAGRRLTSSVGIKRVVDSSGEVVLTEDAQAVDGRYAGFTTSNHEECAVELAVRVAGRHRGHGQRW